MAKVLLVGYIRELLEDRTNALRAAGHQPTLASTLQAAYEAISHDVFDIAVLGYSVPEAERKDLALRLTQACPDIKIVMIYFSSLENTEMADVLIPTTASAQDVLRAVNYLLNHEKSETG